MCVTMTQPNDYECFDAILTHLGLFDAIGESVRLTDSDVVMLRVNTLLKHTDERSSLRLVLKISRDTTSVRYLLAISNVRPFRPHVIDIKHSG